MADVTTGLPTLDDTQPTDYSRQMGNVRNFLLKDLPAGVISTIVGAPGYGLGRGNPTASSYVPPPSQATPPTPAANAAETASLLARYPVPAVSPTTPPKVKGPSVTPRTSGARAGASGAPAPVEASATQQDYLDNSAAYPGVSYATIGPGGPQQVNDDGSVVAGAPALATFNGLGQRNAAVPAAGAGTAPIVMRGTDVEYPQGQAPTPDFFAGLPDGGRTVNGKFVSPRDALVVGYRMQMAARDSDIQALKAGAGSGSSLGYSARMSGLARALGANNFAAVGVGGTNALNQSIAGVTGAGIGASAQMYGTDVNAYTQAQRLAEDRYIAETTPVASGQTLARDPATNLSVPVTTYSMRPSQAGGMPTPLRSGPATQHKEGATGTYQGKPVVYKNGQWVEKK